jgi:hypothetical protein
MAKAKYKDFSPSVDAGYGLIYRLNDLWNGADRKALAGDLDGWNHVLNAIYRNLLYREPIEVEYEDDKKTRIKEIKLSSEDSKIFDKFKLMIRNAKRKMYSAIRTKNRMEYNQAKEEYNSILSLKDIWLRKFMQERGLYLKEIEFDPSRAMWGG